MHRFTGPAHLCSWAGLTPNHRESDTVVHRGHITKQGSKLVRWAAVEAIQRYPTTSKIALDRTRIESRRGKNIAKIAAARKLLTLVYYGLRDGHIRALTVPGRREHPGRNTRAAAALSDPLPGVVANLIGPRVLPPHRSMPTPAGRRDDRQPDPIRPCPNVSAHHTWRRTPHQHNLTADRPASADSMHRAGPASRPFVLATLRALRLDPGPNPVLSTRSPKTSKTTAQQPLDTPRPFRDDSAFCRAFMRDSCAWHSDLR